MRTAVSRGRTMIALFFAFVGVLLVIYFVTRTREPSAPIATSSSPSVVAPTSSITPVPPTGTAPAVAKSAIADGSDGSASPKSNVIAFAPWGSGVGQLGHKRPQEANPEGPMSLTTDASGRILVLDQVNGRIVRLGKDGKPIDTVNVPVRAAQDIATSKDGTMAVLDRLGDKQVALLGPDGKPLGNLPVEGTGIKEGGAVTGVFVDGKDVYVEREHGQLVLIGDITGKAATDRTEIPGRPTRDGRAFISVFLDESKPALIAFFTMNERPSMALRFTRKVALPVAAFGIVLLDTDKAGVVYLGVVGDKNVALLCLDGTTGTTLGSTTLPPNEMPEETFRDFAVLDEGGVIYSARDERGVSLLHADCRK